MEKEKRTGIYFKVTEREKELMEQKQALTGIINRSHFIRKMCIDGYVINLDLPELREVARLLGITSNNANQIARKVNSGGEAYREDVADLSRQLEEIYRELRKVYRSLHAMHTKLQ